LLILAQPWPERPRPVEIGFLGVPPPHFQNVLLNVQAIRINPKANAAPNDPKWQRIGVAAGIGQGGGNAPELQIDLNNSQNIPQLFNTQKVRPGTYKIAQLILDPNNPGTLIPDCPNAGTPEGCINYPIQLTDAGAPINLIAQNPSLISPSKDALAPLTIQLTMTINTAPVAPGAPYPRHHHDGRSDKPGHRDDYRTSRDWFWDQREASPQTDCDCPNRSERTPEIASGPINSNGDYTLILPAANDFGTLYDLAVGGGGDSYAAARLAPLFPDGFINQDFPGLQTNQTLGSITGKHHRRLHPRGQEGNRRRNHPTAESADRLGHHRR